ncbi:MAG: hypothetical protein IJX47_06785 [Clostridia bacterium]|nr:hypothetical protein [Clostridia bacterium]MBQ8382888.1 hypothetical protein [Clostridia bacterium]
MFKAHRSSALTRFFRKLRKADKTDSGKPFTENGTNRDVNRDVAMALILW